MGEEEVTLRGICLDCKQAATTRQGRCHPCYLTHERSRNTQPERKRRQRIPERLRNTIYRRDNYTCVHCGRTDDLTLGHIKPAIHGGKETMENLRTECRTCNSRAGAR